jgi:hypothetical protein
VGELNPTVSAEKERREKRGIIEREGKKERTTTRNHSRSAPLLYCQAELPSHANAELFFHFLESTWVFEGR